MAATGIQVGSDGNIENAKLVDKSNPQTREAAPQTPANTPSPHKTGGIVTRVSVGVDGKATVTQSKPQSAKVTAGPSQAGYRALSEAGMPISLAAATEKSSIFVPALNDFTSAGAAEMLGYVVRNANGQGYSPVAGVDEAAKRTNPKADAAVDAAVETVTTAAEAAAAKAEVAGVPSIPVETDAFLETVQKASPTHLDAIVTSLVSGQAIDKVVEDLNRMYGEGTGEKVEAARAQFVQSGQAVLKNVGVVNPAAFEEWARANHPERAGDAVRDMLSSRSVAKLAALGREFVQASEAKLTRLLEAQGAQTWKAKTGALWVTLPDGRNMTVKSAIENGDIEIVGRD